MIKTPKLVIFDMDGTMLDTETLSLEGWRQAVPAQIPRVDWDLFHKAFYEMIGSNYEGCKRIALTYFPSFNFEQGYEFCRQYMDDYIEKNGIPLKPGLFEVLDTLETLGIQKSVATSTLTDRALKKLALAGAAHRFYKIVGGDQVPLSKPNPDIFLKAAKDSGFLPADCLVIEDSAAGAMGGHRAGMDLIVIQDIVPLSAETKSIANMICDNLHQVAQVLTQAALDAGELR